VRVTSYSGRLTSADVGSVRALVVRHALQVVNKFARRQGDWTRESRLERELNWAWASDNRFRLTLQRVEREVGVELDWFGTIRKDQWFRFAFEDVERMIMIHSCEWLRARGENDRFALERVNREVRVVKDRVATLGENERLGFALQDVVRELGIWIEIRDGVGTRGKDDGLSFQDVVREIRVPVRERLRTFRENERLTLENVVWMIGVKFDRLQVGSWKENDRSRQDNA